MLVLQGRGAPGGGLAGLGGTEIAYFDCRYRPVSECNIWTDDDNPLTDDLPEVETGHVPLEVGGKEVAKKSSVFAATPPGV